MPRPAATISVDEGTCSGDGEANLWPFWDRILSLYEKPHTKREKLYSKRTGHRCSHFAVHCKLDLPKERFRSWVHSFRKQGV
jgi:hypothetical protein